MKLLARLYTRWLCMRLRIARRDLRWMERNAAEELQRQSDQVERLARIVITREASPGAAITTDTVRRSVERQLKTGVLL